MCRRHVGFWEIVWFCIKLVGVTQINAAVCGLYAALHGSGSNRISYRLLSLSHLQRYEPRGSV